MKERPILFSGAMVRAILDGRKTQTRRVIKGVEVDERGQLWLRYSKYAGVGVNIETGRPGDGWLEHCPYGAPGDRLWVRETWSTSALSVYPCPQAWYRADFGRHDDPAAPQIHLRDCADGATPQAECWVCVAEREGRFRWRPSIHMPRWASRITLTVESVRVERLHDISEEDARAEGVYPPPAGTDDDGVHFDAGTYRDGFRRLWNEINGPESWAANPWLWVVGFRRVQP